MMQVYQLHKQLAKNSPIRFNHPTKRDSLHCNRLKPVLNSGSGDMVATVDGIETLGEITKGAVEMTVKFTRDETLKSRQTSSRWYEAIIRVTRTARAVPANAQMTSTRESS